jgi:exopolyphosphatase / guanosine-5'-triphosphate,3'-diphosphate pyrophosphatase
VVDIGTNSMRLLITDGIVETGRWVEVTGLGRGVDATGRLSDEAMERTLQALGRFGELMDAHRVSHRAAMATSATRDADNREEFLDRAEAALHVRPEVIGGDREGLLAFAGATSGLDGSHVVSDIGGGSTEFVTVDGPVSVDIGSVRLSDRILTDRPASEDQMERALGHVRELFSGIDCSGELIGVAGTWTSLGAIDLALGSYDRRLVHHHRMSREALSTMTSWLATMTVEETAATPSLDPARAPVILSGAVVALCVMEALDADTVVVSEHDSLDGLAAEMLDLT